MRTFQFSDAKSHKFWTIDLSGDSFTVTYGKVGAAGQTQTKTFPTPEKAAAAAEKLIAEKTGKGYVETTPKAASSTAEALERALRANPHDAAGWSAYADWLQEQGDPRGEFMAVQLALEDETRPKKDRDALRKREKALLKAHERDWLGPLAAYTLDAPETTNRYQPKTEYAFRRGWLSVLNLPRVGVEAARAVVRAPGAQFLHTLGVEGAAYEVPEGERDTGRYVDSRYTPGPDLPDPPGEHPALHVLVKFPHLAAVRSFRLGNPPTAEFEESGSCHTDGETAYHFVKQMPNIEELYLLAHRVDAKKIFALPMPNLRVLMHYHAHDYPLEKLAANPSLTNLAQLYCFPHGLEHDDEPYLRLRHLRAVCRSPHLTALTHLRLRATDFGDAGAKELVESGILKRLKVLDLQYGCMSDEGAKLLARCPDLKNLEHLDVSENGLTAAGIKALKDTGVKLSAKNMHGQTEYDPEGDNEFLWMGDPE